jgi:hypothetical protein
LRVFIEKIYQNYKNDRCQNSWIQGKLNSNLKIRIYDPECLIPKDCENKRIEALISLMIWEKKFFYFTELNGKYIGKYKISLTEIKKYIIPSYLEEMNIDREEYLEDLYAVQTEDGIFFVRKDIYIDKWEQEIHINVFRFDLLAWYPLD